MRQFRLAVHNFDKSLQGYWYLREHLTGYALTVRDPVSRDFSMTAAEKPDEVIKAFFLSYSTYLGKLVAKVEKDIAQLPSVEYNKKGYRPGWLPKLRKELISKRVEVMMQSRRKFAEAVTELRAREWPTVSVPSLPWEARNNVSNVAAATYLRQCDTRAVSAEPVNSQHIKNLGKAVQPSTPGAHRAACADKREETNRLERQPTPIV